MEKLEQKPQFTRRCVNCSYWVRVQMGLGTCHHHAPSGAVPIVPLPPEAGSVNIAFRSGKCAWPITAGEEFCGDFSQRITIEFDTHPTLNIGAN